jgi:hypothetical protein
LYVILQFCFHQAHQVASGWQFPLVLGQVASKLQQHGWQRYCLRQYALACWQSRSDEECGAAYLQPFVRLHGLRLKLLAGGVVGSTRVGATSAEPTAAAAAAGVQGVEVGSSAGVLDELLGVLQLVGQWCFDPAAEAQLQPLLQQLIQQQQQVRPSVGEQDATLQQLQQLLQEPLTQRQLLDQLQQQQEQQQQGFEQQVQRWRLAVELLVQDSSNALLECQACYMDPLAPARYSLAKGLYTLGRCVSSANCLQSRVVCLCSLRCTPAACCLSRTLRRGRTGATAHAWSMHLASSMLLLLCYMDPLAPARYSLARGCTRWAGASHLQIVFQAASSAVISLVVYTCLSGKLCRGSSGATGDAWSMQLRL